MRMKKVVALALPVAFLLFLGAALPRGGHSQSNFPKAPDFKVTDLNGKSISLSDYEGKVLFLNFWATWCPPCRAEIPDFVEVYGREKPKGLEILGISLDTKPKDVVVAFVEKLKINYPVVLETRSATEKIVLDYEMGNAIPVTIVIDKKGRVRAKQVGQLDRGTLLEYFNQLKAE
jgi:peroxiredoxin